MRWRRPIWIKPRGPQPGQGRASSNLSAARELSGKEQQAQKKSMVHCLTAWAYFFPQLETETLEPKTGTRFPQNLKQNGCILKQTRKRDEGAQLGLLGLCTREPTASDLQKPIPQAQLLHKLYQDTKDIFCIRRTRPQPGRPLKAVPNRHGWACLGSWRKRGIFLAKSGFERSYSQDPVEERAAIS